MPPDTPSLPARSRIDSLDIVRGAVMVLMAIDHVRVYSGLPAGGPAPGIFFTRWVTHFCAPAFVFLAGAGAYLYGQRQESTGKLAYYLASRGAILVLLELTLVRFFWTFNFDYAHYVMAGVLWCIGWSMVLMALLVRLPVSFVGALGVLIIAAHNAIDPFLPRLAPHLQASSGVWLWQILYFGGWIELKHDGTALAVLYSIIPWIGVMAAGFGFGAIMTLPIERRHRLCYRLGFAAVLVFVGLRGFNVYGDPRPWHAPQPQQTRLLSPLPRNSVLAALRPVAASTANLPTIRADQSSSPQPAQSGAAQAPPASPKPRRPQMPTLLSFLNTTKYPASLLFLLMTLGPTILALPLLDRAGAGIFGILRTFGRVPFFFYLLHIPLIHMLALAVSYFRLGAISPWLFENHPMGNPPPPEGYTWNLGLLYVVWLVAIVLLYFPCSWYAELKKRRRDAWLSYL